MKWSHHPTHGFRISATDILAMVCCAIATVFGLPRMGDVVWLFPFVLGHFFLFCNVFRVPRMPELIWAGCFLVISTICLVLDIAILHAMWLVLPVTVVVLGYAIRLSTYHGIGTQSLGSPTKSE